jgi:hypothetical protein
MWVREHVQEGHGPLGGLYPVRYKWQQPGIYHTIEGGGSSTWIGHVNHGLYVPEEASWGGWGGRFDSHAETMIRADAQLVWAGLEGAEAPWIPFKMIPEASDQWTDTETGLMYKGAGTAIYRWRRDYQHDFQARMDWCTASYAGCNHPPVAAVFGDDSDGPVILIARAGDQVVLDARESTDPDGNDLMFYWYVYPEAGTCPDALPPDPPDSPATRVEIPVEASGKHIHVILEVEDCHTSPPLKDYRRIIIQVEP